MDSPLRDSAGRVEDALHDDEVLLGTGVGSEGSLSSPSSSPQLLSHLASATLTFFPRATRRLYTPERGEGTSNSTIPDPYDGSSLLQVSHLSQDPPRT